MKVRFRALLALFAINYLLIADAALPLHDASGQQLPTLAPMLQEVNMAVVNIATFSTQQTYNPLLNDPFFRHFFNLPGQGDRQQPAQRKQQSAGSGVIIDAAAGTIITNYHVVKGADEIQVSLADGRTFAATQKGTDPELDIAVLKISADKLVDVAIGDAEALRVGDFVVAIGNPFGLGQTVTTGIVSALGRTGLGIEGYENFIQTDASINPGNSGGALVNLRGELVGINTAIIAPAGGNVGIGFAIPINMAKISAQQILQHGEVRRGQIGIGIQDITPDLRAAFKLQAGQQGVLVTHVAEDSPAAAGGLKPGDIVVAVDQVATISAGQLRSRIGTKEIGEKVQLSVIREGKARNITVKVGQPQYLVDANGKLHPLLAGVHFQNYADGDGVLVANLAPNSQAAYSGLRPGDIVVGANRRRVVDLKSFSKALALSSDAVLLHINRNGGALYIVIR